jgi:hypothetical protein
VGKAKRAHAETVAPAKTRVGTARRRAFAHPTARAASHPGHEILGRVGSLIHLSNSVLNTPPHIAAAKPCHSCLNQVSTARAVLMLRSRAQRGVSKHERQIHLLLRALLKARLRPAHLHLLQRAGQPTRGEERDDEGLCSARQQCR